MAQPGAHQLGALLLVLALMCDIKINLIMAIYKTIVAAGNALWERHHPTALHRITYCHCKTKYWAVSRIQHIIFLKHLVRDVPGGNVKFHFLFFFFFLLVAVCAMLAAIPSSACPRARAAPGIALCLHAFPFQTPLNFLWLHTKLHRPVPPRFQAQSLGYLMGRVISVHPGTSPCRGSRGFDHSVIAEGLMASERTRSINPSHHDKIKSSTFDLRFFTKLLRACVTSPWTHIKFFCLFVCLLTLSASLNSFISSSLLESHPLESTVPQPLVPKSSTSPQSRTGTGLKLYPVDGFPPCRGWDSVPSLVW